MSLMAKIFHYAAGAAAFSFSFFFPPLSLLLFFPPPPNPSVQFNIFHVTFGGRCRFHLRINVSHLFFLFFFLLLNRYNYHKGNVNIELPGEQANLALCLLTVWLFLCTPHMCGRSQHRFLFEINRTQSRQTNNRWCLKNIYNID